MVERLTQPVDGAAGSGGRGVLAGVVLAVECEAGRGLADAAGALGVALGGAATVAVLGVGAAVVAGLKDLEGLFEGRHGGGCCVDGLLAVVPSFETSCRCRFTLGVVVVVGGRRGELRGENLE